MKKILKDGYKIIMSDSLNGLSDCVLALGNFDGLHTAHAALIRSAIDLKNSIGARSVGVWCFEENPLEFFVPDPPKKIVTAEEKIGLFFRAGADFCIVAGFKSFCDVHPDSFVKEHLSGELGCVGTVCGYNFKFGKSRLGTPETLREFFGEKNTVVVDKIEVDGIPVSSSQIRKFILDGDMESTRKFLGRPYSISTPVKKGKQLGRRLSFPTANQDFPDGVIIPKFGIYATKCTTADGAEYIGASNVGIRPTVDDGDYINCETYILDFHGDIYGQDLKVEFFKLLREEKKFDSVEELKAAIQNDAQSSLSFFESVR